MLKVGGDKIWDVKLSVLKEVVNGAILEPSLTTFSPVEIVTTSFVIRHSSYNINGIKT